MQYCHEFRSHIYRIVLFRSPIYRIIFDEQSKFLAALTNTRLTLTHSTGYPAYLVSLLASALSHPHIKKLPNTMIDCPKQLETYRVSLFLSTNHGLRTPHFIIFRNYSAKLFCVVLSNPNLGLNSIITFQNIFSLLSQKSGNYIIMLRNLKTYFRKPPES